MVNEHNRQLISEEIRIDNAGPGMSTWDRQTHSNHNNCRANNIEIF